jgi:hypothetical protein
MGIIQSIKNFFGIDKRKNVYMHLDEDTIKNNEIIKAQQQKIQAQQSQLSKIFAFEKAKKEKDKEKDKESDINKKLNEQRLDLEAHRHGKIMWLGKFYYDIYVKNKNLPGKPCYMKKYKRFLEITDKNDEIVLGKWGDFGIMEGGKLCIKDSDGNLVSYGKNLNHILYKPDAFENMIRRGRFTIPMDKDGNYIEDLEYKEIQEPLDADYDEDGRIRRIIWSKVKTSEVKKVIADKMEKINMLSGDLEMKESIIIKLKNQLDDIRRAMNIYENQSNISQTELSKSLFRFTETEKRLGDLHMQLTKLTELKATYENLLDRKDEVIQNVLKKLELTGESKLDRLRAELKDDLEFYKAILPERVEIKQEAPEEPKMITQPGEVIKR